MIYKFDRYVISISLLSEWVLAAQSCPTLCDPMDYNLPGSSVHGIFQARILKQVAIFFFRGSSLPRIEPMSPVMADRFFNSELHIYLQFLYLLLVVPLLII